MFEARLIRLLRYRGLDSDKTLGGMPSRSGFARQAAPSSRTQKQSAGETILEPRIDRLSQHGRADGIPAGKLWWRAPFISGQSGLAEQVERQRYRVGNDGRQPDGRQDEDYDEPLPTPKKPRSPSVHEAPHTSVLLKRSSLLVCCTTISAVPGWLPGSRHFVPAIRGYATN